MSRAIRFKLHGYEEQLALAFQHHCQQNLGINDDLNTLAKRILLKFLYESVDKVETGPEVADASGTGVIDRDTGKATVESSGTTSATLADPQTTSGTPPVADTRNGSGGENGINPVDDTGS